MAVIFARETTDTPSKPLTFRLVRGTRWDDDIVLSNAADGSPVDLTGITGLMMRIRASYTGPILMELSIANGKLVIVDSAAGKLGIRVDSATTRTFPENNQRRAKYLYDAVIERTPSEYEPAIAGKVRVDPQITRPFETA